MIRQRSALVTVFLMVVVFMTACQLQSSIGECIPPPVSWEFPEGLKSDAPLFYDAEERIPPSGSWKAETSVPIDDTPYDLVAHNDDIWVLMYEKLFRYRTATRTWDEFTAIGGLNIAPLNLYQARDDTLWAIGFGAYEDLDVLRARPFLARYNDATGQFELVRDRDQVLTSAMFLIDITEPTNNPDGEIWILVNESMLEEQRNYKLLSFNPTRLQVTEHFAKEAPYRMTEYPQTTYSAIAMGPDGKTWMVDVGLKQLASYDHVSGEYVVYDDGHPPNVLWGLSPEALRGYIYSLYVDRVGRLWIDDRGWIDFSNHGYPLWHTVIRSPIFIDDTAYPENKYVWSRPDIIYQSSDGMYWFSSTAGMVRLNPETGEWCKFTTGSSPIAEDSQGNLWIAVYGHLYKYALKP